MFTYLEICFFLIWSLKIERKKKYFSGAMIFLSGTLNFTYLQLRFFLIWNFEFILSGALSFYFSGAGFFYREI